MSAVDLVLSGSTGADARGVVTGLVGVTGLIVGSFVNVVVYRVPRRLSVVQPRSFCPSCDAPVRSFDNVPVVSWLILGGRCRRCRAPISGRYPLVESATGVTFAALAWGLGPHWAVAGFCVLAATVITLVAVEVDRLPPPLSVAAIGTVLGSLLLVAAGAADHRWSRVVGVGVGVVVAAAVVAVATRVASGRDGDGTGAPLLCGLLPVGAVLGWLGPRYAGAGVGAAVVTFVALAAASPRRRRSQSASAPRRWSEAALAAGAVAAVALAVALGAAAGR
jgi:leader peptidase (prepilin peptidase)/N-methyltransferase